MFLKNYTNSYLQRFSNIKALKDRLFFKALNYLFFNVFDKLIKKIG